MKILTAVSLTVALAVACAHDPTPEEYGITVALPLLCVEGTPAFGDEPSVLVLGAEEGRFFPTEDDVARSGEKPALLVCGSPQSEAWPALAGAFQFGIHHAWPRIYLAGRGPRGGLAALPLLVEPALEDEIRRAGANLFPAEDAEGLVILRVTRTEDGLRCRWRTCPDSEGPLRWTGGDVSRTDEEIEAGGIPALAEALSARGPMPPGPRLGVALEIGTGVRMVDLVRVVECAGGSSDVSFVPIMELGGPAPYLLRPPDPEPDASGVVDEGLPPGRLVPVLCALGLPGRDPGEFVFLSRGRPYHDASEIRLPEEGPASLVLYLDRATPWDRCEPLVHRARENGWALRLACSKEDPNFFAYRTFAVPWDGESGDPLRLPCSRVLETPPPVEGRGVVLGVRPGTKAGPVIQATLRLAVGGATHVTFESTR